MNFAQTGYFHAEIFKQAWNIHAGIFQAGYFHTGFFHAGYVHAGKYSLNMKRIMISITSTYMVEG